VIDANGKVKASFGMREYSHNQFAPSLRLLTEGYECESGILIESSDYASSINIYGENSNIRMDVSSFSDGSGSSALEVSSRPLLDPFDENPKKRDSSRVVIKSGVGSPTRLEIFDKEDNHRVFLGNVILEGQNTGVTKEYPT
jgi:hypothetical protein